MRALTNNGVTLKQRIYPALLALFVLLACATGCPAVYPELATRVRSPEPGQVLQPPPPEELRWIRFVSGTVPERTRDGRPWDQVLGSLPDPYARLMVNGKEILRSSVESDTLEPTWPKGPSGNFKIGPDDQLRVELWDSNPLNDKPIGIRDIGRAAPEHRTSGRIDVDLEGGGKLSMAFEPAHAKIGLGLWYELRTASAYISRTTKGGPADRAGVLKGDEIIQIEGRNTREMSPSQIRTAFNMAPQTGLVLTLKHTNGQTQTIKIVEGPIYPTFEQFGPIE